MLLLTSLILKGQLGHPLWNGHGHAVQCRHLPLCGNCSCAPWGEDLWIPILFSEYRHSWTFLCCVLLNVFCGLLGLYYYFPILRWQMWAMVTLMEEMERLAFLSLSWWPLWWAPSSLSSSPWAIIIDPDHHRVENTYVSRRGKGSDLQSNITKIVHKIWWFHTSTDFDNHQLPEEKKPFCLSKWSLD